MKKVLLQKATEFGTADKKAGLMRVPAQSKNLMQMLEGRKIGRTPKNEPSTLELFNAWLEGYDKNKNYECFIEYLSAADNFKKTKKDFITYADAKKWAFKNLERFNSDMIQYY